MRRPRRLPMLVLLLAVVIAAVVAERSSTPSTAERLDASMPTARPEGAVGSTWYCAAGSATGDANGFAEQSVTVTNASDDAVTGTLTAFPDRGEPVTSPLRVGAHSRQTVRISEVTRALWASALVELSGGEVSVAQILQGPAGRAVGACASSPAPEWFFPSGSTRNGARNLMALFNPFPGDATVDLTFDTEDGARTPQQFQGLVLRGGRVTVVDVGAVVTLREHVATTVRARSGRIVAQQIQSSDGREAAEQGLAVTLGSPVTAPVWSFAVATPPGSEAHEVISVLNPGDTDATVEVQVQIDDSAEVGSVEPYRLSVAAGRSTTVDLMADARIPRTAGRWILVRATEDAPIVAERCIGEKRGEGAGGLTCTVGVPVLATEWLTSFGDPAWAATSSLAIANPTPGVDARVTVTVHGAGGAKDLPNVIEVLVPAGDRLVVDLAAALATRNEASVSISSDRPVVLGQLLTTASPVELLTPVVVPVAGTISAIGAVVDPQVAMVVPEDAPAGSMD